MLLQRNKWSGAHPFLTAPFAFRDADIILSNIICMYVAIMYGGNGLSFVQCSTGKIVQQIFFYVQRIANSVTHYTYIVVEISMYDVTK